MAGGRKWVVTTSGDRPFGDVKKALTDAGFAVEQALDQIGVITGTADEDVAERVRAVPGVADVSPDTSINIGPPDAPVTW